MFSTSHNIDWETPGDLEVKADREKISQLLINLITNAIKYSVSGCTIRLSCRTKASEGVVEVRDQGIGISEADQERLFERFYRVSNKKVQLITGFGIDLYLVSELLKLHGRSIGVKSKPGRGSVFFFSLPIHR